MTKLNNTAKLAFFSARSRKGDNIKASSMTGYSNYYIYQVRQGERPINDKLSNAFYKISRKRMKNSERRKNS